MALIHPLSAPAAPECLELFSLPDTQTAVLKRYMVEVSPTAYQPRGPIEFNLRTDTPDYCDLSGLKLFGKFRIVRANGEAMLEDDSAVPLSLYPCTMIKQVDVKLGNQIVSLPQQMFPYKAAIKYALRRGSESKRTQLAAQGYFKYIPGHMDDVLVEGEESYENRSKMFEVSQWIDFEVKLPEECFELDRYLLNNVGVSVRLTLVSDDFLIMSPDADKSFKYELKDMKLKMPMVTVSPGVILGHAEALQSGNALYPYVRVEMMNHSVGKGESNVNIYNISRKSVPSRFVFGIVSAEAYNGNQQKNPLNFKPYDIKSVSLVVNDTVANGAPLEVNFDSDEGREYVIAYNQMFSATGTEGKDFGNDITIEDFKDGYTLFCYNLDPFDNPGKYYNLIKTGFVRLSIQFSKPLPETVVIVIYSEHQDMFQIDAARNVLLY